MITIAQKISEMESKMNTVRQKLRELGAVAPRLNCADELVALDCAIDSYFSATRFPSPPDANTVAWDQLRNHPLMAANPISPAN